MTTQNTTRNDDWAPETARKLVAEIEAGRTTIRQDIYDDLKRVAAKPTRHESVAEMMRGLLWNGRGLTTDQILMIARTSAMAAETVRKELCTLASDEIREEAAVSAYVATEAYLVSRYAFDRRPVPHGC